MIGYILMGLGAYLLYDDYKAAKAKKLLTKGDADETILENGSRGVNSDSGRKSRTTSQESDRDRGVIEVPISEKGVNENELSQKPVQQVKPDTPGGSDGNDSGGQSDATPVDSETEGVKTDDS